ncbi:MAG: ribonuclease [Pseudomonadota bacterium]|jgi:ribonuclease III
MIKELQSKIGYQFSDTSLLVEALSHPSLHGIGSFKGKDYERLEFLGDAVISLVITEILYTKFTNIVEGNLARMKAHLVSKEIMQEIGHIIGLGEYIKMSSSEEHAGGRDNASNLENTLEAIMGAIYLDAGIDVSKKIITRFWHQFITPDLVNISDPKSALQELLQEKGLGLPIYELVNKTGPSHAPEFSVKVSASNGIHQKGIGKSLKNAEKDAAAKLIKEISS